jgi:hypothetical protein
LTPLAVDQVMTGKRCALRIVSDANDLWSGGLFLSGSDRELGILHGRNRDPNSRDWKGSRMEHAGPMAKVYAWKDSAISGFDFYTSEYDQSEGTWFVIDYEALDRGSCTIDYYNHSVSWTQADPNISILIENIPNVDFYVDNVVDMKDFMILASYWLQEDCAEPDWCEQTDIDRDGIVDVNDIAEFATYWLWGITQNAGEEPNTPQPAADQPPAEPEETEVPAEPNVIYSLHDANGLDEIVLETGESIRLNISKQTLGVDTISFCLEVLISDPNAGYIDNREYEPVDPNDPNDPNDASRAEILAQPRDSFFDYYGPGLMQFGDIQFVAVNFFGAIEDGSIASFVYTATQPGNIALMLIDYNSIPSRLEPMIIHQVEPGQEYSAPEDPNEILDFLEDTWKTSADLQQTTSWTDWQVFIEEVKASLSY